MSFFVSESVCNKNTFRIITNCLKNFQIILKLAQIWFELKILHSSLLFIWRNNYDEYILLYFLFVYKFHFHDRKVIFFGENSKKFPQKIPKVLSFNSCQIIDKRIIALGSMPTYKIYSSTLLEYNNNVIREGFKKNKIQKVGFWPTRPDPPPSHRVGTQILNFFLPIFFYSNGFHTLQNRF